MARDNNLAAVWIVRGLTGVELGRAGLAAEAGRENTKKMLEALAGKPDDEFPEVVRRALGISETDVPPDVSKRIEMLMAGSVEPKLGLANREVAVRLNEVHPTIFFQLTNAILSLTGQGAVMGKQKPSGKAAK